VWPTSSTMRNVAGSHAAADLFGTAGFGMNGVSAASRNLWGFADACFDECLPLCRAKPDSIMPIDSSDTAAIDASIVRPQPQRSDTANIPPNRIPYSAAATRGRPTKPAAWPKRSTITAGKSLVLCVTQAPERTA
jgi:hypothetical protein